MIDQTSVEALRSQSNLAAQLAIKDLELLLSRLPEQAEAKRKVLLEAVPLLVEEYGNMAAVGAEEWYLQMRRAYTTSSFSSVLGEPPAAEVVRGNVRAVIGPLFDTSLPADDALKRTRAKLNQVVERSVKQTARSTMLTNAARDGQALKFARVPAGSETCAFCHMLASRGWVYATKESASTAQKTGKSFHAGCDCVIVPSFGSDDPIIEGYDPDLLYQRYLFGEKELRDRFPGKHPTDEEVAALIRRLLPSIYDPTYQVNSGDIPFSKRQLAPLSDKKIRHILHGDRKGGGHVYGATKRGKTQFPPWWTEKDILGAIEDIQLHGKAILKDGDSLLYEGYSRGVLIRVRIRNGEVGTVFPIRGDGVEKYFPEGNSAEPLLKYSSTDYPDVYGHKFS